MIVLVTGSAGNIGRAVVARLAQEGYALRTYDRTARPREQEWEHVPGDLRDIASVRRAAEGVDAVVHMSAVAHDRYGTAEEVLAVNVQGTLNLLLACAEAGVSRIVFFSSVNALGNFQGHRTSAYFPIDDGYPRHPLSPYQLSKHLGEEACKAFSDKYGMTTIALRPVFVAAPEWYAQWAGRDQSGTADRTRGDYWSYVDLRDVCEAVVLSLKVDLDAQRREAGALDGGAPIPRHDACLLCARDTVVSTPTAELLDRYYRDVPWRGVTRDAWLAGEPHRSLLDCSHAERVLGWRPRYSWRDARGDGRF